jgi:HSP20 family protein
MAKRDNDLVVNDDFLDDAEDILMMEEEEEILEPNSDLEEEVVMEEEWIEGEELEGQLMVDVYQTKTTVVIVAPIAGVRPDKIDVAISEDVVTIRGDRRTDNSIDKAQYYIQECFWGVFSRSVILPTAVVSDKSEATLRDGVLRIEIPKVIVEKVKKIKVKPV